MLEPGLNKRAQKSNTGLAMNTGDLGSSRPNDARDGHGWPIHFSTLRSPPAWFSNVASAALIIVALALVLLTLIAIGQLAVDLLGSDRQRVSEAVRSLLPLGAAAIGLPLIIWRLIILSHQNRISEAKTQIDRETHYTSIFSRSVEQLGQTREIKETRDSDQEHTSISRTVPNIEVRLGGIHSLSRLAEESLRDRAKIENTLLSYVRENSWVNRQGYSSTPQVLAKPSDWNWRYDFMRGSATTEAKHAYEEWSKENKNNAEQLVEWAKPIAETRVDVNEAVDALSGIKQNDQTSLRRVFYECLFVGRKFSPTLLSTCEFERCTFVRCELGLPVSRMPWCSDSHFIECKIAALKAGLRLVRCALVNSTISKINGSKIHLISCHAHGLTLQEINDCTVDLSHSIFHGSFFWGDEQGSPMIQLRAEYTVFGDVTFQKLRVKPDSTFKNSVMAKSKMWSVDLSEVLDSPANFLERTEADAGTKGPSDMPRPVAWPAFDPNHKDDFPF